MVAPRFDSLGPCPPARCRRSVSPLANPSGPSPASNDDRDREWIGCVRVGDERAFEAMFRAYKNDLVAYVGALLRSRESAQEIVQDLFLRIWMQRELWEVAGPLNAYLFGVARHRAISHLRHERVELRFREMAAASRGDVACASPPEPDRKSVV